jgi:hypothetical protein
MSSPASYRNLLYELLPGHYHTRDSDGSLRTFIGVLGDELDRVRDNIRQLGRDFYIDSCEEWVIPYLADLVGTNIVFNDGQRNRSDVRNTLRWRRQKGTVPGLEDMAREITGWGARVVELYERLVWNQHLGHLRRRAIATADLKSAALVARVGTPFDQAAYTVDIRRPTWSRLGYQPKGIAVHVALLRSYPWRDTSPVRLDAERYRFHPLNVDTQLFAGGEVRERCEPGADICYPHSDDLPIRQRDLADHPLVYFGTAAGFTVREDGLPICGPAVPAASRSESAARAFGSLEPGGGLRITDPSLFPAGGFSIVSQRYGAIPVPSGTGVAAMPYSPARDFAGNFVLLGSAGDLETSTQTFNAGIPYDPATPNFHEPALLLSLERVGASPVFPESELLVTGKDGSRLLVFLPALPGLVAGQPVALFVADDGSTYFGRGLHDTGPPDLNPDSGARGALLPVHLARSALGQVLPRPGVRPVSYRQAVSRDLCCWDRPLQRPLAPGEVGFDPSRGRFQFPPGEEPQGIVTVDFRYGLTGEVGAGPYDRGRLRDPDLTVAQEVSADFTTIQAAIDNLVPQPQSPAVIEIRDSRRYTESLSLDGKSFPGGLIIQAAAMETPVIRSPGPPVLHCDAATAIGRLVLDGLVLAGGPLVLVGNLPDVILRFCTLQPATAPLSFNPAPAASLLVRRCITGAVTAGASVTRLSAADSIVQSPAATIESPGGGIAVAGQAQLQLRRVTVLGELQGRSLDAGDALLAGPVTLAQPAQSCLRYSRRPPGLSGVPTFQGTGAVPVWSSIRYGDSGYFHLHPNSAEALRRGGEEGGEIGANNTAEIPWRLQNLGLKLEEYLPAGLTASPHRVYSKARFPGVLRV